MPHDATDLNVEVLADRALADAPLPRTTAQAVLAGAGFDSLALVQVAGRVRRTYFGDTVNIHVLNNVQNGACAEDCGYCGQSRDSGAPLKAYKLKPIEAIVAEAAEAQQRGAYRYCMALAGRGPDDRTIDHMAEAICRIKAMGLRTCLSAGLMDEAKARRLADAGLDRLNHNLNTSRRHYPTICSTHSYDDRMATLAAARAAGLGVCCGLIVGMGETHDDLLDVIDELHALRAESIPVNFLLPIEGNPIQEPRCNGRPLDPWFVLRVLCAVRLANPRAEVRIAAGREYHLRTLQALALWPANSLFMDGYLLSEGAEVDQTLRMILDAGFVPNIENPGEASRELLLRVNALRADSLAAAEPSARTVPLKMSVVKK